MFWWLTWVIWGFPGGSDGKASACNAEDLGLIPQWGRYPGEGNGNPLQYSCLENSMDRGARWATVHGGLKESDKTERLHFYFLSGSYDLSQGAGMGEGVKKGGLPYLNHMD